MKLKLHQAAVITTLCLAGLGGAYASDETANDALAIHDARIGLTEAIATAEQQVGGKAARAEYDREQGHWVYNVEVVNGSEVTDVQVDPASGKVLAAVNDPIDQGGDEEHEGRGEEHEADED